MNMKTKMCYVNILFRFKTSWRVVVSKPKKLYKLCNIFYEKKSQESYIFNQESLASFKVTTNNKFPQVFESNLILMID